jgi:hypothetical protein
VCLRACVMCVCVLASLRAVLIAYRRDSVESCLRGGMLVSKRASVLAFKLASVEACLLEGVVTCKVACV